jgi:CxxC-x17-CxxC domain-containing protein
MDFTLNPDITYFAKTNFRGTDKIFGIKRKDRRQHTYVLGKSGTGKSTLIENMIIQNIYNGEGVCVVDPHGELVEKIMELIPESRAKDVIYFNPADTEHNIGFNPFQLDDPKYRDLVAAGLMGIFTKIWANAWSSRMEYILQNCILALLDVPGSTLLGIPRLLVDKDYRQYVINNVKDPVIRNFWIHEYEAWRDQFRNEAIQPIQNKVGQFLSSAMVRNIVGQQRSTINIFDMMNDQKIFLVNVSKGRIGEDNSSLLGGMLITKIQLAAMERIRIPEVERKDYYLYIDEFQNFSTESFASILSEARKYRLCLTIAHQYTAQLEEPVRDAVFGNVGTMIIFRVGADDADTLEKEFQPEFDVEDFVNLPNYQVYLKLMVDGVTSRPFSATTMPPLTVTTSAEMRAEIINISRKLYTRDRQLVEEEINKWSTSVPGQQSEDGSAGEGKFRVECANDKKVFYVPFEPDPTRPLYCRECLLKIKNGELEALPGFRPPKEKNKEFVSYDALSNLGIEFTPQRPQRSPFRGRPSEPVYDRKRPPTVQAADPDKKESLQSVISRALHIDLGKKNPKVEPPPVQKQQKPETMSLSALADRAPIVQPQSKLNPDKVVKEENRASLKDAINRALQQKTEEKIEKPEPKKEEEAKEATPPVPKKTVEVDPDTLKHMLG